jgi:hypothetical protein
MESRRSSANDDSMSKSNKEEEDQNRGETPLKEDLVRWFCFEKK